MATGLSNEAAKEACKEPPADTKARGPGVSESRSLYTDIDYVARIAAYRPAYPNEMVETITNHLMQKLPKPWSLCVDLGCGSGNSTRMFIGHFHKVIGLDNSESQLVVARRNSQGQDVEYLLGSAESMPFDDVSVDLCLCSLSLHFFDLKKFFPEVDRVLRPGGCLAAFGFQELMLKHKGTVLPLDSITKKLEKIYDNAGCSYGLLKRTRDNYKDVQWPYEDVNKFQMNGENCVNLDWLVAYLSTRLAHQTYVRKTSPEQGEALLNQMVRVEAMKILGLENADDDFVAVVPMFVTICRKPCK